MSEKETETQGQKAKTSKLAIASLLIPVGVFVGWMCFILLLVSRKFDDLPELLLCVLVLSVYLLPVAFILGIWALIKIKKSKGLLRGCIFSGLGLLMCVPLYFCLPPKIGFIRPENMIRVACKPHMMEIAKAMQVYANNHNNQYPTVDKWCDLLVMYCEVGPHQFVCPSSDAKEGESSFAFNKNLIGKKPAELPPDIVLLFETKGGWNQVGGPELLSVENHNGKGCNILFNDGHVEFVRKKQLGKLNWGDEQKQ